MSPLAPVFDAVSSQREEASQILKKFLLQPIDFQIYSIRTAPESIIHDWLSVLSCNSLIERPEGVTFLSLLERQCPLHRYLVSFAERYPICWLYLNYFCHKQSLSMIVNNFQNFDSVSAIPLMVNAIEKLLSSDEKSADKRELIFSCFDGISKHLRKDLAIMCIDRLSIADLASLFYFTNDPSHAKALASAFQTKHQNSEKVYHELFTGYFENNFGDHVSIVGLSALLAIPLSDKILTQSVFDPLAKYSSPSVVDLILNLSTEMRKKVCFHFSLKEGLLYKICLSLTSFAINYEKKLEVMRDLLSRLNPLPKEELLVLFFQTPNRELWNLALPEILPDLELMFRLFSKLMSLKTPFQEKSAYIRDFLGKLPDANIKEFAFLVAGKTDFLQMQCLLFTILGTERFENLLLPQLEESFLDIEGLEQEETRQVISQILLNSFEKLSDPQKSEILLSYHRAHKRPRFGQKVRLRWQTLDFQPTWISLASLKERTFNMLNRNQVEERRFELQGFHKLPLLSIGLAIQSGIYADWILSALPFFSENQVITAAKNLIKNGLLRDRINNLMTHPFLRRDEIALFLNHLPEEHIKVLTNMHKLDANRDLELGNIALKKAQQQLRSYQENPQKETFQKIFEEALALLKFKLASPKDLFYQKLGFSLPFIQLTKNIEELISQFRALAPKEETVEEEAISANFWVALKSFFLNRHRLNSLEDLEKVGIVSDKDFEALGLSLKQLENMWKLKSDFLKTIKKSCLEDIGKLFDTLLEKNTNVDFEKISSALIAYSKSPVIAKEKMRELKEMSEKGGHTEATKKIREHLTQEMSETTFQLVTKIVDQVLDFEIPPQPQFLTTPLKQLHEICPRVKCSDAIFRLKSGDFLTNLHNYLSQPRLKVIWSEKLLPKKLTLATLKIENKPISLYMLNHYFLEAARQESKEEKEEKN